MTNASSIGSMNNGVYELRGVPVPTLIKESDFVATLWLAWSGERPSASLHHLLEACLVACVDHGVDAPSTQATRAARIEGRTLAQSVAAGIAVLGPVHGNAAGPAALWVREAVMKGTSAQDVVAQFEARGERIPGIGHRIYEIDPRTQELFALAKDVVPHQEHLLLITEVARMLSEKKGKTMPVNVDGAIGAIIASLGAEPDFADALFIVARTVGLVAHARETAA